MSGRVANLKKIRDSHMAGTNYPIIGQIVQLDENGRAKIDYQGNSMGPLVAKSIIDIPGDYDGDQLKIPVLIIFENGDPLLPIIIGIVRETLLQHQDSKEVVFSPGRSKQDVIVDGESVIIDANQEIVLRCGKSSITLKKNGKIVVRGTQITSRASATNKIRGGAVSIN